MSKIIPDISHYHPVKDWAKAKASCELLISKATEGTAYVDPTLKSFIRGCEANNIPYWLYSFARKGKELDGAKFLVKTCKDIIGPNFVGYALDVENALNGTKPNCSGVIDAMNYLTKQGYKTMLYTMYAQYSIYKQAIINRPDGCVWWEARYGSNNGKDTSSKYPCHADVDLHQYTSAAKLTFCNGGIDLNKVRTVNGITLEWYKDAAKQTTTNCYVGELPELPSGSRKYYKYGDGMTTLVTKRAEIKKIQKILNWYLGLNLAVDGKYGEKTRNAVQSYQRNTGIKQINGCWGDKCQQKAKTVKK